MKKPWLAVLLNIIPGLGYLYLNTRKVFAWLLVSSQMALILSIIATWNYDTSDTPFTAWDFLYCTLIFAAFLFDAYFEAKRINASTTEESKKDHKNIKTGELSMTGTTKNTDNSKKVATPAQRKNGLLLALLAIPFGIIAGDILWAFGFIASIVSYGIAWSAIKLYTKGAGAAPDKTAAKALLGIILVGIVLSFLGGMAMDTQLAYSDETHASAIQAFTSLDFWNFYFSNFPHAEMWGGYFGDIILTVIFAALGCYSTVRDLFIAKPVEEASTTPEEK